MEQERKLVLLLELGHELEQERKLVLLLELWHELERELSKLELEAMLSKPGAVSDRCALQEESAAVGVPAMGQIPSLEDLSAMQLISLVSEGAFPLLLR